MPAKSNAFKYPWAEANRSRNDNARITPTDGFPVTGGNIVKFGLFHDFATIEQRPALLTAQSLKFAVARK
jgi:hypothetical protein